MKTEIFVNPNFSYLTSFVNQIPLGFNSMGIELHHGRNEVRKVSVDELLVTVKYFKRITLANRFIFATIRKSKAQRAYEHSRMLIRKNLTSPEPVAYVNCYRYGLLYKSFYVSLYTNYSSLTKLLDIPIAESEEGLKAFARFTYNLHSNGILHDDYTVNNVLYSNYGNDYDFSLIDNNRMRFRNYSYRRGLRNLERLKIPVDKMGVIALEYAKEAHASELKTLNAMVFFRLHYILKVSFKKWVKAAIRLFSGKHDDLYSIQLKDLSVKSQDEKLSKKVSFKVNI